MLQSIRLGRSTGLALWISTPYPYFLPLRWHPHNKDLLSASMDKSVILWCRDSTSLGQTDQPLCWLPKHRMSSEFGGETSGLYDAMFSPCGDFILFHSFFGSFHMWSLKGESPAPVPFPVGGHFDSVEALCWDKNGNYILTW